MHNVTQGFYRVCSYGKVSFKRDNAAFLGPLRVACTGAVLAGPRPPPLSPPRRASPPPPPGHEQPAAPGAAARATPTIIGSTFSLRRNATYDDWWDFSKYCTLSETKAVQRASLDYAQQQAAAAGFGGQQWTANLSGLVAPPTSRLRTIFLTPLDTKCMWASFSDNFCTGPTCAVFMRMSVSDVGFFYTLLRSLQKTHGAMPTTFNGKQYPEGDVDPVPELLEITSAVLASRFYTKPYVCHNAPSM